MNSKLSTQIYNIIIILSLTSSSKLLLGQDPFQIHQKLAEGSINSINIQDYKSIPTSSGLELLFSNKEINALQTSDGSLIKLQLPINNQEKVILYLNKSSCYDADFNITEINNGSNISYKINPASHFKGEVKGMPGSIATMSIFDNEIYGFITLTNGMQYSIITKQKSNDHISCKITNETKENNNRNFAACATDDYKHYIDDKNQLSARSKDNCKIISISIHTDYELYLKMNANKDKISNYVISVFNNVQAIYRKDDIQIAISELIIHTSPENFPHTTSMVDLEYFRSNYPTYNGNVNLLISGFNRNGTPALGGIAYVNSLCMKTYSFAFVNVQGVYSNYPTYSWDIFVCAHELGHIFGSRHTHACVWGPNKNQAIDNCAKPEGSCPSAPTPTKGTLMSYCHTAGNPGVDFNLGLGPEPRKIILDKINSASCLSSYIPTNRIINESGKHIYANTECFDGIYTHYYNDNNTISPADDILILSIKRNGQDIGNIYDGTIVIAQHTLSKYGTNNPSIVTAPYVPIGKQFIAANKYWEVLTQKQPTKEVSIKFTYTDKDFLDLKSKNNKLTHQDLLMYSISYPGNPNPESNHDRTTNSQFMSSSYSNVLNANNWIYTKEIDGSHTAEFLCSKLNGGGIGYYINVDPNYSSNFELYKLKITPSGGNHSIDWSTASEKNTNYFIVEKSINGIKFDSIGKIPSIKNSTIMTNYKLTHPNPNNNTYYRLRMVDQQNNTTYSVIVTASSSYTATNKLNVYPNPCPNNYITMEYNSNFTTSGKIDILDINGFRIKSESAAIQTGKNYFQIDVSQLNNGFYYLNISTSTETYRQKFSINRT